METNSILEKWYESNKEWPIATLQEKVQIAKETNLKVDQVENWLKQKRFKLGHNRIVYKYDCLPSDIKTILDKFFDEKPYPNYEETQNLKKITGLHDTKIKSYFNYRNSKKKKNLMNHVTVCSDCE